MIHEDPHIDCPACGETVQQVVSATLSLALWQHWNWTCKANRAASPPAQAQEPIEVELRAIHGHTIGMEKDYPNICRAIVNCVERIRAALPPAQWERLKKLRQRIAAIEWHDGVKGDYGYRREIVPILDELFAHVSALPPAQGWHAEKDQ